MKYVNLRLWSGPLLFALCLLSGEADNVQLRMLGIILWMLAWWISNAVPIGITALLPMVAFPLLGIMDLREATAGYANPIIYLFFGGFVLGLAIEKWNLHKRIALNIMSLSGNKPSRIILGSMLATALLSSLISNTATAIMMLPIGMSVVSLLGDKIADESSGRNFGLTMMLGIAYAANIGGMTTLIGTPPNLVLASLVEEQHISQLDFASWLFFAFPLVVLLFITVYLINSRLIFPIKIKSLQGTAELISSELKQLGGMKTAERRVLWVMAAAATLWIFRAQLNKIELLANLSDTIIAIAAAIVLFAFPSGETKKPLLLWKDTKKLPWQILLLFGGGISLARGMEATEMVELVGSWISNSGLASPLLLVLVICVFAVFLTEIMSNVAMVSVFIPVAFVIAQNFGLNEMQLALPLTLGASCAFMFPISTPPNAIVYSSGYIKMNQMALSGILLNLACILIISLYCWWLQPYFFS